MSRRTGYPRDDGRYDYLTCADCGNASNPWSVDEDDHGRILCMWCKDTDTAADSKGVTA